MKRMEVTEKVIGENTFYIRPFGAFTATNISGELAAVLSPLLAGLAPLFGNIDLNSDGAENENDPLDMDIEKALPSISNALSTISGDKLERLVKRLIVDNKNVSVVGEEGGDPKILSMDLADEVFCGDIQDMFILCIAVINVNFKGFFKNVGVRSGSLIDKLTKRAPTSESGETSTSPNSAASN